MPQRSANARAHHPRCILRAIVFAMVCASGTAPIFAQYIAEPLLLEGDFVPGTGAIISGVGRPSVNPAGIWACEGDDTGSLDDDFLLVAPGLLLRSGDPLAGTAGVIAEIDPFETNRTINAAAIAAWTGTLSGVSVTEDEFLARGGSIALLEGAPSPIAMRNFAGFSFPSIDDGGTIYFEADLDGATSSDEVLLAHTATGTTTVLAMNAQSHFREGSPIIGGDLDGHTWDNGAFIDLRANGAGTIVVEGDLETTGVGIANSFNNEVLIRKKTNEDYELLLREGETVLASPMTGSVGLASIIEIDLANNDDWAIRGALNSAITTADFNDVIVASLGGAPPEILAQEGIDLSAQFATPGVVLGAILGVRVNSAAQVLMLANVRSIVGTAPVDEALFLIQNGSIELVLSDETTTVLGLGTPLTGMTTDQLALSENGQILFGGTTVDQGIPRDGLFEASLPTVFPVENLTCLQTPGLPTATALWQNASATPYDGLRVWVDGVWIATLGGSEVSYETAPLLPLDLPVTIAIEPFVGNDVATSRECSAFIVTPPDVVLCSGTGPMIPDLGAVTSPINAPVNAFLRQVRVSVDIAHSAAGDLRLELSAPNGTSVQLLDPQGSATANDLVASFHDPGAVATAMNLSSGAVLAPSGPGDLADLRCSMSGGTWSLTVTDEAIGGLGALNDWCLEFVEEPNVNGNCCPLPSQFTAVSGGPCLPGAQLSWQNNSTVAELWVRRVDSSGTISDTALSATTEAFWDPSAISGETYTYELWVRCTAAGLEWRATETSVTIDNTSVPMLAAVSASADPCAGVVDLSWDDLGVPFTSVSLFRDGVFFADVTGLATALDNAPPAGPVTYRWVANCGATSSETEITVDTSVRAPENTSCSHDRGACDGVVELTWTNPHAYDSLEVWIDGTLPLNVSATQTAATTAPLSAGWHTIEWVATCGGQVVTTECSVLVSSPLSLSGDAIVALEGSEAGSDPGATNSAADLARALAANGIVADVIAPIPGGDLLTGLPCGVNLGDYSRLWITAGTFPNDRRLSAAEADFLAFLNRDLGVALYLESGDHWGFQPVPSSLDARDGVADGAADGDDTLTALEANPTAASGAAFATPVAYAPENIGSDYNDQLIVAGSAGTSADPEVVQAIELWRNSPDALPDPTNPGEAVPYGVTIAVEPTVGAPLVVQSWEFGGFALDRTAASASDDLRAEWAAVLLDVLGGESTATFYRGDPNDDGDVNIADAIFLLGVLFPAPGSVPSILDCEATADVNADGGVNIADAIALLERLFLPNTPALPLPNEASGCGIDPVFSLPCAQFSACP